jgi:hypothetical protein
MDRRDEAWTRGRLLRVAIGGGAVVAGGAATASWNGGRAPAAAQREDRDEEILNFFLLLERVQDGFYREALGAGALDGDLRRFARIVGAEEGQHVARLTERLGGRADAPPRTEFGDAVTDPDRFRTTAIELEETAISAYIAQAANLSRDAVAAIVPLVSVEARQAAWVRDLAGVSPAPEAADRARERDEVLDVLRDGGFIS